MKHSSLLLVALICCSVCFAQNTNEDETTSAEPTTTAPTTEAPTSVSPTTSTPTSATAPPSPAVKPLPKGCYKFEAHPFGDFYVDMEKGIVYGGLYLDDALADVVLPPEMGPMAAMVEWNGTYVIASVKTDFIEVSDLKVTKLNVTSIEEETAILFKKTNPLGQLLVGMNIGLINHEITIPDLLINVGKILESFGSILDQFNVTIPPGDLGLHNITQFLPLSYEYFEGLYLDADDKPGFRVIVPPSTIVYGKGEKITCQNTYSVDLPKTAVISNTKFVARRGVNGFNGVLGIDTNNKIVAVKVSSNDFPLPSEYDGKEFKYYMELQIKDVTNNMSTGKSSITLYEFNDAADKINGQIWTSDPEALSIFDKFDPGENFAINEAISLTRYVDTEQYEPSFNAIKKSLEPILKEISMTYYNVTEGALSRINFPNANATDVKVYGMDVASPYVSKEFAPTYVTPPDQNDFIDGNSSNDSSMIFVNIAVLLISIFVIMI